MISIIAANAVDKMLRDVCGIDAPVGGEVMIFVVDFRKTFPIIPLAYRAVICSVALRKAMFWPQVSILRLNEIMLVRLDPEYTS